MYRRAMSDIDVKLGVQSVLQRLESAYNRRPKEIITPKPQLVAVSKTKPAQAIIDAYSAGQLNFGENYVQELIEKATNPEILAKCKDIKWHFIGHLQSNKVNKIINLPGLYMVQTIHNQKIADVLNAALNKVEDPTKIPLHVLLQINTSGEDEKNGIEPSEAVNLYRHILENCKNLQLDGIMTIGKYGHDPSSGINPDFVTLMNCHNEICVNFAKSPADIHVSMGMSDDFEQAIELGSTIVRVGSSIFGYRPKKNET